MLIPKNRHEYYLAVISGNDYPTFPPKIREEQYLAKLAGREVDVPIPKTPKERAYYNIINDIKFEPENRWQTFVAAANDDSITAPIPRTREEIWWANISLSHEVIVEYTGTLPATLQTVEGYLESYKIYGSAIQDGTPTPENPIVPSGCGVRTGNLFEVESDMLSSLNWALNPGIAETIYFINYKLSDAVTQELKKGIYTCSIFEHFTDGYTPELLVCAFTPTLTSAVGSEHRILTNQGVTFVRTFDFSGWQDIYLIIGYGKGFETEAQKQLKIDELFANWRISIVKGSTAPQTYIPYGFMLPLTVNGVEYPIYLGEGQTTRRIGKIDLGTLNWVKTASENFWSATTIPNIRTIGNTSTGNAICDMFNEVNPNSVANRPYSFSSCLNFVGRPFINKTGFEDLTTEEFKQAMSGIYMYYVLAEPETTVINEPLMKIGDYADTIDSTQTIAQIPTAAGTTVIDYEGTPKPDKVELTYKTVKRAYISSDDEVYQDPNGQLLGG